MFRPESAIHRPRGFHPLYRKISRTCRTGVRLFFPADVREIDRSLPRKLRRDGWWLES